MPKTTNDVTNFLSGIIFQETLKNALIDGLKHTIVPKGVENSSASFNLALRSKYSYSLDPETKANALYLRHEPDCISISPQGKIKYMQIRSKYCVHAKIEDILNDNFEMNEFHQDVKLYPTVRFVYLDTANYIIRSLSSTLPLTALDQEDNWNRPWTWIDGLHSEDHYYKWIKFYFLKPLKTFSTRTLENSTQTLKNIESKELEHET